eukprot:9357494-Pyramimonas_sp.AAC.1
MRCLREGVKREEFFEKVEEEARKTTEEEWREAAARKTPDRMWDLLGGAVRTALKEVFPPRRRELPEWQKELRDARMMLLDKRRGLREGEGRCREEEKEELEHVQEMLRQVSAALKDNRRTETKRRQEELATEIWEAYLGGRWAEMHALRVEYARNGRGPKKRYYYASRTYWSKEEWATELERPPYE